MIRLNHGVTRTILLVPLLTALGVHRVVPTDRLLLDDFSQAPIASIGTRWEGFSDRVMGGISDMSAGYGRDDEGNPIIVMTGDVSLENNGGFIQVRLPLSTRGVVDASAFTGVAVEVRGAPGSYFIHARTRASRLPWQYYDAPLAVDGEWRRVEIPFATFTPESTRAPFDPSRLVSVAIVGAGRAFSAEVQIRRIELYR